MGWQPGYRSKLYVYLFVHQPQAWSLEQGHVRESIGREASLAARTLYVWLQREGMSRDAMGYFIRIISGIVSFLLQLDRHSVHQGDPRY